MIDLSIIIVTYNSEKFIGECLRSIKKHTEGIDYEIIVVDNASADGSVATIRNLQFTIYNLQLIKNKRNYGFAAGNNIGIKKAKGRYVLLLNPDTKLTENSLLSMVLWMDEHPRAGVASCGLVNPDGAIQPTGGFSPNLTRVFLWATFMDDIPLVQEVFGSYHPHTWLSFYKKERELDWVTGAFFMIRREVLDQVGMLDEDFFLYVEEVEYSLRIKKSNWQIWYVPKTRIIHHSGASGTREGTIIREYTGLKLLYQKHYALWQRTVLRFLLLFGSLVRIVVFAIMDFNRAKMYVRAISKV